MGAEDKTDPLMTPDEPATSEEPAEGADVATAPGDSGEDASAVDAAPSDEGLTAESFIEQLLSEDFDGDPDLGQSHKGLPGWEELLATAGPEQRKALGNARVAITKAQQERSAAQKEVDDLKRIVAEQQKLLLQGVPEAPAAPEGGPPEFDLLTVEGQQQAMAYYANQAAEKLVRERLEQFVAPIKQHTEQQQQLARYEGVKSKYPQLQDEAFQKDVVAVLKRNDRIDLEDAVLQVIGKRQVSQAAEAAENRRKAKAQNRKRGRGPQENANLEGLLDRKEKLSTRDLVAKLKEELGVSTLWPKNEDAADLG